MARDWHEWYRDYDDPESSLSRRLAEVRRQVRGVLVELCPSRRTIRALSLCAGDGRDLLPELGASSCAGTAVLAELDPTLAERARTSAPEHGDWVVDVRTGDAGDPATWADAVPADLLLMCGIFGNITDHDVARTIVATPALLRPGGTVIWTRGRSSGPHDPSEVDGDPADWVRDRFLEAGLHEVAFVRPTDAGYRVGVHRNADGTGDVGAPPVERLFTFVK